MDLFSANDDPSQKPLAFRMSPKSLDEVVGQKEIIGEGKLLRRLILSDKITSIILYGPPGVGKTAIARVIANTTKSNFEWLNAATASVDDIRNASKKARHNKYLNKSKTILFLDEIHRFNKLQQDSLLPDVEEGLLTLIGATTENPLFYVNSALVSRSQIFELKPLSEDDIRELINRSLNNKERGLGNLKVKLDEEALNFLAQISDGDGRKALSALELAVLSTLPSKRGDIKIDIAVAQECIQKKALVYDRNGNEHYDTISAFIKSMRGSDPDATLYYLAKMIYAGEDPRFIARRIVICASEDVGNADPLALVIATSALQAVELVGMPEGRIPLAQAAVYIASAPKSNASYVGINEALKEVETNKVQEIPDHLKNKIKGGDEIEGMKNRGKGYKYSHDSKDGFVEQSYMQNKKKFYMPKDVGYEKKIKARLAGLKNE